MKNDSVKTKFNLFLLLFLLTSVVSLALFVGACNKDKAYVAEEKIEEKYDYTLDVPKEYNLVGQLHNEGLDSVFNAIKIASIKTQASSKGIKTSSVINYESIIESSVLKFCKNNIHLKDSYSKISTAQFTAFTSKVKSINQKFNRTLSEQDMIKELNPAQIKLLKEIRLTLKGKFKKTSIAKLKAELGKINKEAAATLTKEEAAPIYSATSTAFASYQYWMKNYRKWYYAMHYPELLKRFNDDELNRLFLKKKTDKGSNKISTDTIQLQEVIIHIEANDAPPSPTYWDHVSVWWADHGDDIMYNDTIGATEGILRGAFVGGLPGAVTGAVTDALWYSASGYFWSSFQG